MNQFPLWHPLTDCTIQFQPLQVERTAGQSLQAAQNDPLARPQASKHPRRTLAVR